MEDAPGGANAAILQRIRQMWQFANLCQWIYIFGKAAKIDESLEIDVGQLLCVYWSRSRMLTLYLGDRARVYEANINSPIKHWPCPA
jgi:hypothetical protein